MHSLWRHRSVQSHMHLVQKTSVYSCEQCINQSNWSVLTDTLRWRRARTTKACLCNKCYRKHSDENRICAVCGSTGWCWPPELRANTESCHALLSHIESNLEQKCTASHNNMYNTCTAVTCHTHTHTHKCCSIKFNLASSISRQDLLSCCDIAAETGYWYNAKPEGNQYGRFFCAKCHKTSCKEPEEGGPCASCNAAGDRACLVARCLAHGRTSYQEFLMTVTLCATYVRMVT